VIAYPITPVGKPRMTRSDKWKQRPAVLRYRAFKDEVRTHRVWVPEDGASILFVLPMPTSWSGKKRAAHDGQVHRTKPDVDNLLKALLDALYEDDSGIHTTAQRKVWGVEGRIVIAPWSWPDHLAQTAAPDSGRDCQPGEHG